MIHFDPQLLGKEVELGTFPVTAEAIRAFAEAVGDLNPLYLDRAAARQAGYPEVIAPPTFCMHLRGGRMLPEVPLPPGMVSLHAGQELEFYDEILAGQTYTATAKVTEVYEKTGRSGPLGVIVREMTIRNAAGSPVVVLRERQIIRSPEKKI
ncbi:MAG: MaoC family dehydratase N-terminal domain-containing protein [Candidatus Binatia bacterium]|nr:MaoC family dehydratase N-terminal domain-containing protein [Candidatus Binatia bacterium]